MPFERLRAIVFSDIRERGLSPERIEEYARAWAASAAPDAHAPMPCPACFARNARGALKGRSIADGYAAAYCDTCHTTFQFSKGGPSPAAASAVQPSRPTGVT